MSEDEFLRSLPLYLKLKLPDDIFNKLKLSIELEENKRTPYNQKLAGNIESEFRLINVNEEVSNYLKEKSIDFLNAHQFEIFDKKEIKIDSMWVNRQKKYEFNPIHNHTGKVSFVTWIKIPYDIEEELRLDNCKNSNSPINSKFSFTYSTLFGQIRHEILEIDKSWEGTIIFFDSRLHHQVYPFYTSDDYRISVSGNFIIEQKNDKNINRIFSYK